MSFGICETKKIRSEDQFVFYIVLLISRTNYGDNAQNKYRSFVIVTYAKKKKNGLFLINNYYYRNCDSKLTAKYIRISEQKPYHFRF